MAQIGTFTAKDGSYTGTIRTMTINVKAQLVPNKDKDKDKDKDKGKGKGSDGTPDFRLYAGGAELGAAWRQASKEGEKPYLAVKLDDPSFAKPVRAAFFENEADGTGVMMWKRATPG